MNVTVFGATGAIGQLVVGDLLAAGHTVTAYVRKPGKVSSSRPQDLHLIVGEITDAAAIDSAVAGADAVISALGPSLDRTATGLPLVKGTRLIIDAMKRHGVRRFIGIGTPSIVDERDKPTLQQRFIGFMGRTMLPRAYQELLQMSQIIMTSGLNWTIVRFSAPKNGPAGGVKRYGFFGTDKIGMRITRADIAAFTAAQLTDDRFYNAAPAVSNQSLAHRGQRPPRPQQRISPEDKKEDRLAGGVTDHLT
jgi:putative NADH-flavin reductase